MSLEFFHLDGSIPWPNHSHRLRGVRLEFARSSQFGRRSLVSSRPVTQRWRKWTGKERGWERRCQGSSPNLGYRTGQLSHRGKLDKVGRELSNIRSKYCMLLSLTLKVIAYRLTSMGERRMNGASQRQLPWKVVFGQAFPFPWEQLLSSVLPEGDDLL